MYLVLVLEVNVKNYNILTYDVFGKKPIDVHIFGGEVVLKDGKIINTAVGKSNQLASEIIADFDEDIIVFYNVLGKEKDEWEEYIKNDFLKSIIGSYNLSDFVCKIKYNEEYFDMVNNRNLNNEVGLQWKKQ